MGNCFGGGGGGKKKTSTTSTTPSPPNKTLSTWTSEWEEKKWIEDTRSIWMRSLKDLPVHMDLPRLAGRLAIYLNGELVSSNSGDSAAADDDDNGKAGGAGNKADLVYAHLCCIARSMNQPELVETIESRFWEFVRKDGSGDASQQVLYYLPHQSKLIDSFSLKILT